MEALSMSYKMDKNGINYEMGASVTEVGPGDVVKVGPGRLEVIASVERSGKWDRRITTASGKVLGMMDALAYGKREEKK